MDKEKSRAKEGHGGVSPNRQGKELHDVL